MCDVKLFLTFASPGLVLLWQLFYLFCSPVFDRGKSGYIVEFHNGVDIVVLMSRRLDQFWIEANFFTLTSYFFQCNLTRLIPTSNNFLQNQRNLVIQCCLRLWRYYKMYFNLPNMQYFLGHVTTTKITVKRPIKRYRYDALCKLILFIHLQNIRLNVVGVTGRSLAVGRWREFL
jgi:hypothetical protein